MANKIQVKRGAYASLPVPLNEGEFGFCTNTKQVYIGDGSNNFEVVMHDLFGANSILAADAADTPASLAIAEQRVLGRITAGNIVGLTGAQLWTILTGQAGADLAMNTHKITGVTDPTAAQDAATKAYVDAVAQGLTVHASVVVATTANITLSGEQTIDGILSSADRILVKSQTAPEENGIYVSQAGAWSRAADMDAATEFAGGFVFIESGTTLGSTGFVCTNEPEGLVVGTTEITFAQFSSAGYVTAGIGLTKTGNDIAISDAELLALAGLTFADQKMIVGNGAGTVTTVDCTTFAQSILDDANEAAFKATVNLEIGTDVLAQQTVGIANDNLLEVDGTPLDTEMAVFTAAGINGLSKAEVMALLSGGATASFAMNSQLITGVLDPVSDQDAATKKWVNDNYGELGANAALSNLVSVALNTALLPDAAAADDFGSAILPFKDFWLAGSSATPATNNFKITGASTSGTRVVTLPDESGTVLTDVSTINGGAFA